MKKADKPLDKPESVTIPPISESTPPPATNTASDAPPVETVTAPPISQESTAPVATPGEVKPVETAAPPIEETAPIHEAQPIKAAPTVAPAATALPPAGRGSRTLDDYRKLDWTKTNADLAREAGVTRQAIAQIRKKLETTPTGETPDFSDVAGKTPTAVEQVVNYDVMAVTVFDMSTGLLTMTFGQEWQPREQKEKDMVVMALKAYFQSKQVQDIPPGLMLTAICLAYAAPRLREPNTSSKLRMGWTWLKMKFASFRKKKTAAIAP